jgi:hypothetical protein
MRFGKFGLRTKHHLYGALAGPSKTRALQHAGNLRLPNLSLGGNISKLAVGGPRLALSLT